MTLKYRLLVAIIQDVRHSTALTFQVIDYSNCRQVLR